MINKKIINRIAKLEILYPTETFDVEEYTKEIINMLENLLGHPLIINLSNKKYYDKETLNRDIFRLVPIKDLRILAYGNNKIKKEN